MIDLDDSAPRSTREELTAFREWVRAAFELDEAVTVMVTELTCLEPGCPPIETVVAVMSPTEPRWQFKVHKRVGEFDAGDRARLTEHWRAR